MDWLTQRPEHLVDRADAGAVLPQVRAARELAPAAIKNLDYALRQWTMVALTRTDDVEGLLELDDLMAVGLRKLPTGDGAAISRTRWQAFRDLLESKRLALGSAQSGRARNLLHADPILKRLQDGEVPQSVLKDELHLSAARLSQVLGVMEEGGLIRRRKRGKENFVSLPHDADSGQKRASPSQGMGALVWGTKKLAA